MRKLRTEISEILVKYGMPTRQVAISEIVNLFLEIVREIIGHDELSYTDKFGYHNVPTDYQRSRNDLRAEQRKKLSNLISEIEGGEK